MTDLEKELAWALATRLAAEQGGDAKEVHRYVLAQAEQMGFEAFRQFLGDDM